MLNMTAVMVNLTSVFLRMTEVRFQWNPVRLTEPLGSVKVCGIVTAAA